ncbi:putative modifying wall lignin-1/2 [Helianthus annuus]|uniref:Uncharacterized protein n=1 Tax=Helianthus annuus TaxID=4232 RepID=A0A9K3EKH1_HELAN|nr:hypothetical protein HanXRQr2_Chr13g0605681 [Helianthus annuus]KAJ0482791.1 putative modifying wall lignin-1/2 [Helianthus annuus]KAJ0850698.1 hypothetical protein HanPSC8_Chr13g0583861 [Helianthus annuus]KAJ0859749.1 putative modifying wall lignin-1/2 [Helianthus annuus]
MIMHVVTYAWQTYELRMHINYGLRPFCDYPSSPAVGLAIAGAIALVLARIIITVTTDGCCSCYQRTPNEPICAQFFLIISWITSSIALILFIAGAKLISQNTAKGSINDGYHCYILNPGVFSAAGIVGVVSVLFSLVYYILYVFDQHRAAKKSEVDLELEKPPVTDVKKPTISDGMKPQVPSQKH